MLLGIQSNYEDPLSAVRGAVNGVLLSVAFFWLPLAWWVFG